MATVFLSALTEEQQDQFIAEWQAKRYYSADAEADCPTCCPWLGGAYDELEVNDPEDMSEIVDAYYSQVVDELFAAEFADLIENPDDWRGNDSKQDILRDLVYQAESLHVKIACTYERLEALFNLLDGLFVALDGEIMPVVGSFVYHAFYAERYPGVKLYEGDLQAGFKVCFDESEGENKGDVNEIGYGVAIWRGVMFRNNDYALLPQELSLKNTCISLPTSVGLFGYNFSEPQDRDAVKMVCNWLRSETARRMVDADCDDMDLPEFDLATLV